MRNYNIETSERTTRIKAIMVTLAIHFGLLYGLLYMNSEKPEQFFPDFVKEWISSEEAVASKNLP